MNFNWNIDFGQVITLTSLLISMGVGWGFTKQKLNQMEISVREIKEDLRSQIRDNSLLGNTVSVLQQRMLTLEGELERARDNIHRLANHVQGSEVIQSSRQGAR